MRIKVQMPAIATTDGDIQAEVLTARHFLVAGPFGSEDRYVTLFRTYGGGHKVHVGCWGSHSLDEFEARIQPNGNHGWWDEETATLYRADYEAFIALARLRAQEWIDEMTAITSE